MATTALVLASNRFLSKVFLVGSVSTVALDAQITEEFILPPGFGELLIEHVTGHVHSLSAAYVAPAPAFDGMEVEIISADGTTNVDALGSERFVHSGTSSARPTLSASIELYRTTVLRRDERLRFAAPIIAGAGATGTVLVYVRGQRITTA